jgi:outer membrane protein assembly factor BamB
VIADGYVYVAGEGGQMAAIELRRGLRAWDLDLASSETPWVAGDYVYVVTDHGDVLCILRQNGRVRWVSGLPRLTDPDDPGSEPIIWSGPILVGDRLLLAGSDGRLVALSPYNGAVLGQIDVDEPILMAPIVANRTVFVLTEEAELIALR